MYDYYWTILYQLLFDRIQYSLTSGNADIDGGLLSLIMQTWINSKVEFQLVTKLLNLSPFDLDMILRGNSEPETESGSKNHDSNVSLYSKYKLYMNFIYEFKQINKCQVISKSIQYECIWSSNEVQNLIFEFDIQNKLLWVELKMVYISCIFDRGDWSKILYIIYSILYTFYFVAETFCQKGEKICSKRMWDRIHWPG